MLLLAAQFVETGKTRIAEQMPDEMGAASILPEERKNLTIALDGKTVRSTGKMEGYDSPLHIISAQISELGVTFASRSVDGKSNEIPAVQ